MSYQFGLSDVSADSAPTRGTGCCSDGATNYASNLRRLGFTDEDLSGTGSDRLIDALVAHGDPADLARDLTAHLDAGADQVGVRHLGDDPIAISTRTRSPGRRRDFWTSAGARPPPTYLSLTAGGAAPLLPPAAAVHERHERRGSATSRS